MGKSYRKHPYSACAGGRNSSEKDDKRLYNRKLRSRNKSILNSIGEEFLLDKLDVSDVWGMSKDGKHRFDPDKYPEDMRK